MKLLIEIETFEKVDKKRKPPAKFKIEVDGDKVEIEEAVTSLRKVFTEILEKLQ